MATAGKRFIVPERNDKPTAADLGFTPKDVHEARQIDRAEEADPGIVRGELAENFHRKDFLPSEAVAIADAVEAEEKRAAWLRQSNGAQVREERRKAKLLAKEQAPEEVASSGKLPEDATPTRTDNEVRARVAFGTGMKPKTLEKARAVVKAAEEDPETFGKIAANMDKDGGKVNSAFKALTVKKKAIAIRAEPPPLQRPSGKQRKHGKGQEPI